MKWGRNLAGWAGRNRHPLLLLLCLLPMGLGLRMAYNGQPEAKYYEYNTNQYKPLTSTGLYWTGSLLLGLYGAVFLLNRPVPARPGKSRQAAPRVGKRQRKK